LLAAPHAGIPSSEDLNRLNEDVGIAASPVNISNGTRWNAVFAYLDPVRNCSNLKICDQILVDRLVIRNGRVTGIMVVTSKGLRQVEAGRVVLAAGTYGSPAILLRSGIGEPAALKHLGIATTHELPGVGKNLHDHSSITISFSGTPELERLTAAFSADHWAPEEQVIAKVRSPHCSNAFDLHLYPIGGLLPNSDQWRWKVGIACMTPQSRGLVALRSSDPTEPPIIDHRFLSDAQRQDQQVLVEGIEIARQITRYRPLSQLLGEELPLSGENRTKYDLSGFVKKYFTHYYHPVGTCKMGLARDRDAVVSAEGSVHGLEGLYICDCSIMPVIPRANTNVPVLVVAERIASFLLQRKSSFRRRSKQSGKQV
jgi:choline dehydrogenase